MKNKIKLYGNDAGGGLAISFREIVASSDNFLLHFFVKGMKKYSLKKKGVRG